MRHSAHLYILECTPDLVSVIHLDSYSNCENPIRSRCLWHFDHQVFKAPQSLVGGFNHSDKLRENQQCLKPPSNQHLEDFSCFTPSQTPSLCPFSTPSRRADIATAGQIIYEEILKPTCILIRWALEPTAGQVILVPNPFVCYLLCILRWRSWQNRSCYK